MKVTSNIIQEVNISHLHKTNIENLTQMEAITENPIHFSLLDFLSVFSRCKDRDLNFFVMPNFFLVLRLDFFLLHLLPLQFSLSMNASQF